MKARRPRRIYVVMLGNEVSEPAAWAWTAKHLAELRAEQYRGSSVVTFIEQLPKPAKKRRKR